MNRRILWFYVFLFFSFDLAAAKLESIQIKKDAGKTSLLFSLDAAIVHKIFTLTNPDRVVVDFEQTDLAYNLNHLQLNNALIRLVRSGRPKPNTLRLVFEVTDAVMLRTNPLGASSANRHGFSLDLSANHKINSKKINKPAVNNNQLTSSPQIPAVIAKPKALRDVVVVLDPGHGGNDPGAMGPKHSREKNITLAIAIKLKQLIDKQPGMRAVLTRNGDYYVGLRERLKIARKHNGDVFISIHADAFINQQSNGASIFALSQRGATSEAARWLAEKENYSELGGVNLRGLDDHSGLVRTVLIDLSQTATISASLHMGEAVLGHLNSITNLHNHKVEQARFMVLKSPDIPSILIETGFISNPREEKNLTSASYQLRLCQSIFQGLNHYFHEYPPHGTSIEVGGVANNTVYVVQAGDSLSKIAAKYHIPMATLQAINHLNSNQVRIGQTLRLPDSLG